MTHLLQANDTNRGRTCDLSLVFECSCVVSARALSSLLDRQRASEPRQIVKFEPTLISVAC